MLSKNITNHIVAKVSGVKPTDSKIEAANKAIEVMRQAGFSASAIRKAERMRDDAIARGVK
ncbi:MAG TPA: hypothetical protein VNG73_01165 [Gemmatimonadaceae bacterium]|nr:hypothetical protein [Gemmatimonadaceae bacterium]